MEMVLKTLKCPMCLVGGIVIYFFPAGIELSRKVFADILERFQ